MLPFAEKLLVYVLALRLYIHTCTAVSEICQGLNTAAAMTWHIEKLNSKLCGSMIPFHLHLSI